jgi:hypothetical protein
MRYDPLWKTPAEAVQFARNIAKPVAREVFLKCLRERLEITDIPKPEKLLETISEPT